MVKKGDFTHPEVIVIPEKDINRMKVSINLFRIRPLLKPRNRNSKKNKNFRNKENISNRLQEQKKKKC